MPEIAPASNAGSRRPGRPRSVRAHQAVLAATCAQLRTCGFEGTSIDGVAARAGVSKATIYRWWSSKEELVVEALGHLRPDIHVEETDDPRADLLALVTAVVQPPPPDATGHHLMPRLLGAIHDSPELAAAYRERIVRPRRHAVAGLLQRAVTAGQLPAGFDVELGVDLLVGPVLYRRLITGDPFEPHYPERLVAAVFDGPLASCERNRG